jgi:hypothetical protein
LITGLKIRLVHVPADDVVGLLFLLGNAINGLVSFFFLIVVVLSLILIGRGRNDREPDTEVTDRLNRAVGDELVVF